MPPPNKRGAKGTPDQSPKRTSSKTPQRAPKKKGLPPQGRDLSSLSPAALYELGCALSAGLVAQIAAHDTLNPLTALKFQLSFLREELVLLSRTHGDDIAPAEELCHTLSRELSRLEEGLRRLGPLAPFPKPRRLQSSLGPPLSQAIALLTAEAEELGVTLPRSLPKQLPQVFADPGQLTAAFVELLRVAIHSFGALRQPGPVIPSWVVQEDRVRLSIPTAGVSTETHDRGLSLVRRILSEHGGALLLEPSGALSLDLPTGDEAQATLPGLK